MRFKCDENLPVDVAELLGQNGHDAIGVSDQQLAGRPDADIAAACKSENRVLITLDLDFADIRAYPPGDYSGIIVLRPTLQTITALFRLTRRVLPLLDSEPLAGRLWIVDETRVRIRTGSTV
jgi:predicted nuclease of predicted toxin-antitoxin system